MPLQPFYIQPGICKNTSSYAAAKTFAYGEGRIATGRYVDGNNVRFVAGFPEKVGGWTLQNNSLPLFTTLRSILAWSALTGKVWFAVADANFVWVANSSVNNPFFDITPQRTALTSAFTNQISTTINSDQVVVTDTAGAALMVVNDMVFLSAATVTVGGITFNGWFHVISVNPGVSYTVNTGVKATSSVSLGGGVTTSQYTRNILGTNPFATTSGSTLVTVTETGHGAATGDTAHINGATAVAGLTLNGAFVITKINANSYTINAATTANATTTGGGTAVVISFNVTVPVDDHGFAGWTMSAYGSLLLLNPIGGSIYVFDPSQGVGTRAYPLLNAPASVDAMFVTPERFVIALGGEGGSNFSAMTLQWPDQNDFTNWTPAITNTANIRTLQGGLFFVNGIAIRNGASLALTNSTVFLLNYTGDVFVYQTPKIADNCGLIGPQALCVLGEVAYWMSDADFWSWNGSVIALPSDDIRDYVFKNISVTNRWKSYVVSNKKYKEIEFHYPSTNATECDSYVIYHTDQQCWSIGTRQSTAGIDTPFPYSTPLFCDYNANVMLLESGTDNTISDAISVRTVPLDSYITTSEVDVTNGTQNVGVYGFLIDTQRQTGALTLTINSRYYPEDAAVATGPYTLTPPNPGRVDLRVDGKEVGFKIESNVLGGDFRLALSRLDLQPSGARR